MAVDVSELMAKVGRIRILTGRLMDDELAGDYHTSFKGQGVEFEEVRPYAVGDDVRSIDWNVTARTGLPYVKRYSEERERAILFAVDVSGSQGYGSGGRTKAELSAEVAALLALTAIRNHDKVGLVLFSDRIVKYLPPRKGRDSVLRLAREVLAAGEDAEGGTDFAEAVRFVNGVQKRRAVVFLVSDFMFAGHSAAARARLANSLRATSRRHDLVCIAVEDPAESELPAAGLVELADPETGETAVIDTSDPRVRTAFARAAESDRAERARFFAQIGAAHLELSTDRPYIDAIRAFFKRRARQR